jgi:hypothetical protein
MSELQIKCLECNTVFEITEREKDFYNLKGFKLPKRCKSCRDIRKRKSEILAGGQYHPDGGKYQKDL